MFTVYTQSNITSISLVYRFTVKNRWIGKDSLLQKTKVEAKGGAVMFVAEDLLMGV
jgi:hypothetical protein